MRTKLWKGILAAVAATGLMAGTAMAASIDFSLYGNVYFDRNGDGTGTITLSGVYASETNPTGDWLLGKTVTFDPAFSYTSATNAGIVFATSTYDFTIKDGSNTIFTAQLNMGGLTPIGPYGLGNIDMVLNLSNVWVDAAAAASSDVLNAFSQSGTGILTLTFQDVGSFVTFLNTAGHSNDSFSGKAAPGPNAVPEPATMLLFGTGLLGLAGVARRKMS